MNPFNFLGDVFNQMLINPRAPEQEKRDQFELKKHFEKIYGNKGYFLIPSSGSSAAENQSVKLIALHQSAIMNSAQRVNDYFKIGKADKWGCVLPTFHVAGLGIYARAFLHKTTVIQTEWDPDQFKLWLQSHQINVISLVPTQVYDLVQRQVEAPGCVKLVFVGGSKLSKDLKDKILQLQWPIVMTYGMTETSSMIAVNKNGLFEVFPDIDVTVAAEKLRIRCNSLMTCSIQRIDQTVVVKKLEHGWLQTEDRAEVISHDEVLHINLLGRDSEFLKINGEGVSLSLLRDIFGIHPQAALISIPDNRSENMVVVAVENGLEAVELQKMIENYNLRVRPFEKIKRLYKVSEIPKTELEKVKYSVLEQTVRGLNDYEEL